MCPSDQHSTKSLLTSDYTETLRLKLLDPDEKVRAAVCRIYSQLDYEMALHHASEAQLRAVAGRGLDKKVSHFPNSINLLGSCIDIYHSNWFASRR